MRNKGFAIINVCVMFGLILTAFAGAETLQHTAAVQEYEPTEATIVAAEVAERTDSDGDTTYRPEITYRYTVDGQTHEHDNVFPGGFRRWSGQESWAKEWITEYPDGQTVTVHYDPSDPGSAYLVDDGLPNGWLFLPLVAGFFSIVAIGLFVSGFRKRHVRSLVKDAPLESIGALAIGPSAVEGTVVSGDRSVETSIDEPGDRDRDDPVMAVYTVEDYHEGSEGSSGDVYTVDQHVVFEPFYIDDGSGRVLVEPDQDASYEFDDEDFERIHTGELERGPELLQQHFEPHEESWKSKLSGRFKTSRSYDLRAVREGDKLYVFGSVDQRTDVDSGSRDQRRVIRTIDGGLVGNPLFLFSDQDPRTLVDTRRWVLWRLPYGLLLLVVAASIVLLLAAPVLGIDVPAI